MIKGTLKSGFEFEYDETQLDDMRFLDLLAGVEENPLLFSQISTMMLGKEQKEALYKHLEDENGRVSAEAFGQAIGEIMEQSANLKN